MHPFRELLLRRTAEPRNGYLPTDPAQQPHRRLPRRRAEVRVAGGHREVRVPHQLLDCFRARSEHRRVCAERVAEAVDAAVGQDGQIFGPLGQPPDALSRKR